MEAKHRLQAHLAKVSQVLLTVFFKYFSLSMSPFLILLLLILAKPNGFYSWSNCDVFLVYIVVM